MANANKAKGTKFETDVTKFLLAAGIPAHKPRQAGRYDVGDIHVDDDVILQAKAWDNMPAALTAGLKGADLQVGHARREYGIAVIKRPRAAIAEAIVAMPLRTFVRLLRRPQ